MVYQNDTQKHDAHKINAKTHRLINYQKIPRSSPDYLGFSWEEVEEELQRKVLL